MDEPEIVELFRGDAQLVCIWRLFLIYNKWMYQNGGRWHATDKAKEYMVKLDEPDS